MILSGLSPSALHPPLGVLDGEDRWRPAGTTAGRQGMLGQVDGAASGSGVGKKGPVLAFSVLPEV